MNNAARPDSLAEAAERILADGNIPIHMGEFLDRYYGLDDAAHAAALEAAPPRLEQRWAALLGGVAEHLSRLDGRPPPAWSDALDLFLPRAWFAMGGAMKSTLLAESPASFRRRQIFVSANALSRASQLRD